MQSIHFIINPIAGSGNHQLSEKEILSVFDTQSYSVIFKYTQHKKHAIELTKASIVENATIIVACGGDGTINEVASCIVGTHIQLGIIPVGSGNGLASNLKIPKKIVDAIQVIKKQKQIRIDVGSINNRYFFSNAGIGFDAAVIYNYENFNSRKLITYAKATFKAFKEFTYSNTFKIEINEKHISCKPFMIFMSNSNEMGYNFSLTPQASLQDGLLDVLVVTQMKKIKFILFTLLALFNKHTWLQNVMYYQTKKININSPSNTSILTQIDGESYNLETSKVTIEILPQSLQVLVC